MLSTVWEISMNFTTCPNCSRRIPSSVYFCPYCAHPAGLRGWIWLRSHLVLVLLAAILLYLFGRWLFFPSGSFRYAAPTPTLTSTLSATITPFPILVYLPTSTPAPTLTEAPTNTPTSLPTATPTLTPTPSPTPITIVTQLVAKDNMVQVYVPAGEFKMGSTRSEDPQALDEELPQHIVSLDAYWIDQTEVTNAQYALCVAAAACTKPKDTSSLSRASYYNNTQYASFPVIYVTWDQAAAYCKWGGRRLPTEAEWEKAARGPDGRFYPWGNTFDGSRANYCDINCVNAWKDSHYDDGYTDTSPVGDYPDGASPYGALDMAGNVYEWVADWFGPYSRIQQSNPTGPVIGLEHIIRGGSWGDDQVHIRSAVRSHVAALPAYQSNFIGFRCAR